MSLGECKRVWISVARKALWKLKNICVSWTPDKEMPTNLKATVSVPWVHYANSIKTSMKKNLLYNSENLFSNPPFKKNAICSGKKIYYIRLCTFLEKKWRKKMNLAASLAMVPILFWSVRIFFLILLVLSCIKKKVNTAEQIHNRTCFELTVL